MEIEWGYSGRYKPQQCVLGILGIDPSASSNITGIFLNYMDIQMRRSLNQMADFSFAMFVSQRVILYHILCVEKYDSFVF